MAKGSKAKGDISWPVAIGAIIALGLIFRSLEKYPGLAAFVLIAAILGFIFVPFYLNRKAVEGVEAKARDVITRHISVLVRQRIQLLTKDPYGTVQSAKWNQEIDYFLRTQLIPVLTEREKKQATGMWIQLQQRVEVLTACAYTSNPNIFNLPIEQMNPSEFEQHCAQRLRNAGWSAQITKATGDQGIDVIAEKLGSKIVLQCKLYNQPVGNKAVQEAAAGRVHYGARFAGVVTNASFTPAAKQLAASNSILLIHFSELDELADRLGLVSHEGEVLLDKEQEA